MLSHHPYTNTVIDAELNQVSELSEQRRRANAVEERADLNDVRETSCENTLRETHWEKPGNALLKRAAQTRGAVHSNPSPLCLLI